MFVPIVGPIISAALLDVGDEAADVLWRAMLVNLAVGQFTGALLFIGGLTSPDGASSAAVTIQPMLGPSVAGLALLGSF